jgi:DNA-binding NtrC family response regulator
LENEILNIEYHIVRLILKALNRYPKDKAAAAAALGISKRTLHRRSRQYRISKEKGMFVSIKKNHRVRKNSKEATTN